jgi:hypothetical protein
LKKNFFEIGRKGYQNKGNFALISKMCRSLEFGKRGKNCYRKTDFLGLGKFRKKRFSEKKSLEILVARVLHIFEISTKFRFF